MNAKAPTPKAPLPEAAEATDLPKPAVKAKPAAKPAAKKAPPEAPAVAESPAPAAAKAAKPVKEEKPPKIKMVRDSYTMPENDYAQFAELKKRCLQAGIHVKKSELLRAGLASLSGMTDAVLTKAVKRVETIKTIKTGRPAKQE